jgi:hypothetical protein
MSVQHGIGGRGNADDYGEDLAMHSTLGFRACRLVRVGCRDPADSGQEVESGKAFFLCPVSEPARAEREPVRVFEKIVGNR